jgi:hypothetical protein
VDVKYHLRCNSCGGTVWTPGQDDPDTNSFEVDAPEPSKWDEPTIVKDVVFVDCPHEDYDVTETEYDEYDGDLG